MSIKIAINGFGRIGRLAFRQIFNDPEFEVAAINDLTSPEMLAYLLKYDSVQGGFNGTVSNDDHSITVDGKQITIYKEADPKALPWKQLGIDVVLECTGFYCSKDKAQAHIDAGAKNVIISAPAGSDLPTIVYNTNHEGITKLTESDIRNARELGCVVKLIGITRQKDDEIEAGVYPMLIPDSHPMASVNDVFNAVFVHGDAVDDVMGKCSIKEAYIQIRGREAWVVGMNISPYEKGNIFNKDPLRERKLLLHTDEIRKLAQQKIGRASCRERV